MPTYSTYEAKARFSEVIRKVRAGQRITISYRGRVVAEIRPIRATGSRLEEIIAELEDQGIISPPPEPTGALKPLASKPGALGRFLESRE